MSTPTATAGSKRPPGSVSTPSHLNQSSPPRSVPSPVAARHAAGKTPINHPTSGSSQGSKTIGSTPMVQNLGQTGNNASSPGANMLSFNTPNGLGIEGGTPSGLNIPTPALGGAAMMPTMSDLGLTTSGPKRNEDEERRAKMRKVLKSIGRPKGRVGEEGILRVGRRVGFTNDEMTVGGSRKILIAGNVVLVDVHMRDDVPRKVEVSHPFENDENENDGSEKKDEDDEKKDYTPDGTLKLGAMTGRVLLNDLQTSNGIYMNADLNKFAMNLEILARTDRLCVNNPNGFHALYGIQKSLFRLYERERDAARAALKARGKDRDEIAEMEVMCKKSGKPIVHGHGKLGLEIAYWRDGRLIVDQKKDIADTTAMDVDGQGERTDVSDAAGDQFSLRLEIESSPAGLYPSMRISDEWLPNPFELPEEQDIPWLDPPPTFCAADGNGQPKLPDLRFVARFDPPLAMPYQTAMNVLSNVGASQPPMLTMPAQYATLLLGSSSAVANGVDFKAEATRDVLSERGEEEEEEEATARHNYILENVKLDWGYEMHELPFSHPKQLVDLLPTFRQWACVGALLKKTFHNSTPPPPSSTTNGTSNHTNDYSLEALLSHSLPSDLDETSSIPINIALATAPTPTLALSFPTQDFARVANMALQVLPNADLAISMAEGVIAETDDEEGQRRKLARALNACEDLGVWVEWVRNNASKSR